MYLFLHLPKSYKTHGALEDISDKPFAQMREIGVHLTMARHTTVNHRRNLDNMTIKVTGKQIDIVGEFLLVLATPKYHTRVCTSLFL